MKLQRDIFIQSEGDAWFARNKKQLGKSDPVLPLIQTLNIRPSSVLEVGCANGWRLHALQEKYFCEVAGVEPSAIARENYLVDDIYPGVASDLGHFPDRQFDMLIYGFCLYVCDPIDYFRIAAEGDRVLADGGHLIIHDFKWDGGNYRRRYKHHPEVWSHHYNFARLWVASPLYQVITASDCADSSTVVLQKRLSTSFAEAISEPMTDREGYLGL